MRVLLDTNVVLDVLLERSDWLADADIIWQASRAGRVWSYVSASSITDLFYISRKLAGRDRARQIVRRCLDVLGIIGVTRDHLEAAYDLETGDFEDDLQTVCALAVPLDVIVTRNPAHFSSSAIPVWTPRQLIAHLTAAANQGSS